MPEYSAIKIVIGLSGNRHQYPDFSTLDVVRQSGLDWSYYVDQNGLGWQYDKCCDHRTHTQESPYGQQFGMLVVEPQFAVEACQMFPDLCVKLTEAEVEDFWNNHAHAHEPDEILNTDILQGIKAKQDLGIELTDGQQRALDANDPSPGITRNTRKVWATAKEQFGVSII